MIAACYLRKSNDEGDKTAEVKSTSVQNSLATAFAAKNGWTLDDRYIFADDGVSGAEFRARPGLQALLGALEPAPPFQILLVAEQSRLGRETLDTLFVIRQLEDAGVAIWSTTDGRQITMGNDTGEIMATGRFCGRFSSARSTSGRAGTGPGRSLACPGSTGYSQAAWPGGGRLIPADRFQPSRRGGAPAPRPRRLPDRGRQ